MAEPIIAPYTPPMTAQTTMALVHQRRALDRACKSFRSWQNSWSAIGNLIHETMGNLAIAANFLVHGHFIVISLTENIPFPAESVNAISA